MSYERLLDGILAEEIKGREEEEGHFRRKLRTQGWGVTPETSGRAVTCAILLECEGQ